VVQEFVRNFRARFGGETPDSMAALGYDSARVLLDAIRRAGTTDSAALRAAIAATRDFPGVTGTTTLDSERNATKAITVITIKDGHFEFVENIAP